MLGTYVRQIISRFGNHSGSLTIIEQACFLLLFQNPKIAIKALGRITISVHKQDFYLSGNYKVGTQLKRSLIYVCNDLER